MFESISKTHYAKGKEYFDAKDPLLEKYRGLVHLLKQAVLNSQSNSSSPLKQKISIIDSEQAFACHLNQFKNAIPHGKAGKFTFFIFDSQCTFLAEMHYGHPKAPRKYQEICIYVGSISKTKPINPKPDLNLKNHICFYYPSRLTSELSNDLLDSEKSSSSEDEQEVDESLEPEPSDGDDSYLNIREEGMTVNNPDIFDFRISTLPSLDKIKQLLLWGKNIDPPKSHMQIFGKANYESYSLFGSIKQCLLSGHHDEEHDASKDLF